MREYIFRGKRVDNGEWIEGSYYNQTHYYGNCCERHYIIASKESLDYDQVLEYYEIYPETVGQYVGLCDKNGNKIFEGDIVIFNRGRNLPNTIPRPLQVFFDDRNAQFTCFISPYATLQKDQMSECEVIGNIYNNPELLEVE